MFQRELQSTLGADYMDRTQRNRNTGETMQRYLLVCYAFYYIAF